MFPSSNNINNSLHPSFSPTYFNQSSTTSSSSSSPLFGHGSDTNFFLQPYYHHHHFPQGQFLLACVPETAPTEENRFDSANLMPNRHVKKDRHSKIYTSQGLRDRRVRLSIGIARQFFDLQELLGFDKASNTIEWLLTKSRKAIRKLAESKASSTGGGRSSSSANSDQYEMVSGSDEDVEEGNDQEGFVSKNKLRSVIEASGEEMGKSQKAATMQLLAKESRAKARERAKERTREKTHTSKLGELKDSSDPVSNRARSSTSGLEGGESMKNVAEFGHPITYSSDHTIEESIVIGRKIRQSPGMNYQQTWMLSRDLNSNSYLSCMPQNWDINGSTIQPTFAALSSINSLAEHHSYEKPWEAHNNDI